ncbi:hypothetical protein FACS1894145_8310 [Bacteroidia bacterium]|nr:hypothetical protein FACS189446_6170 [Bacteroidia bacterium]GHU81462.1 hypothetical protein FACS1894145_8310 [Bacteroidia bacterium]
MRRYILLPVVLLIYLAAMAYFTYPGRTQGGLSYTQYYITLGVTIVIIAALSYFLKKKDDNNKKYKE